MICAHFQGFPRYGSAEQEICVYRGPSTQACVAIPVARCAHRNDVRTEILMNKERTKP
jgi:hypothetical protein